MDRWSEPRRHAARDLLVIALIVLALVWIGSTGPFDRISRWLGARLPGDRDEILFGAILTALGLAAFAFQRARETRREAAGRDAAEARFREVVERIPAVTYTWDPTKPAGSVAPPYISPQVESILGFTPDEWRDDPQLWIRQIHPDDRKEVLEASDRSDRTGEPYAVEYRHMKKDGTVVWIREEALVVERGPDGKPTLVQGVMYDVTDRKRVEASLAEAEARYRNLVEQVPAVTYVWDGASKSGSDPATYLSPQVEHLLGFERAAFEDPELWNRLLHPADRERVLAEWDASVGAGAAFRAEYRMRTFEDRIIWVHDEAVPVGQSDRGFPVYQGVVFDITDRKEAEAELVRAQERYQTLVEQLPVVVYQDAVDEVSTALYISPQYERMFGYPVEERLAQPTFWIDRLHPEDRDRVIEESNISNATGEPFVTEYRFLARNGRYVWVRDEAVLLRDEVGRPLLWQGVLMDVSERREAEATLARRDGVLEAISFAAGRFLKTESWEDVIDEVLARVGSAVGASRAYVFENGSGARGLTMTERFEWVAPGVTPTIDQPGNRDYPYADGYAAWEAELPAGRPVTLSISDAKGPQNEDLRSEDIRSCAGVPVIVGDDWWGFLGFDDCATERTWSTTELDLLSTAADTLGAAIARRHAEVRLAETERRYRTLIETMPAITYIQGAEPNAPITYMSPQVESILGYAPAEFEPSFGGWVAMIHPDDRERVLPVDRSSGETGDPFVAEYRLRAQDGRWVWVRDQAILVHEEESGASFWQGVLFDITERKQAEEDVHEAERRYRSLVENLPAVTYVDAVDERSTTVYVSPQLQELFGYAPEDWVADPDVWVGALHPEDRDRVLELARRHNRTGEPFEVEYRMRTASGEWRWVGDHAVTLTAANGEIVFSQGVMFDVTERRRAEEQLRETESRYRALVEHIPAVLYVDPADEQAPTIYVSPQVEQLLGITRDRYLSDAHIWRTLIHPDDDRRVVEAYREALHGRTGWSIEYRVVRPDDGRIVWLRDESTFLPGAGGGRPLIQGVLFDVTERKLAEEALHASERREREAAERLRSLDEMKNTFLAAVSHELRSPLTAILGLSVTLEQTELDREDQSDLLRRLAGNARKLDRLLKDLLDIDRLNRGIVTPKYRPTDVAALVRRTVENFDALDERTISVEADPIVLPIDPAKVERIVENLLANSLRHTAPGTPVWVQVRPRGGGVLIAVEDEGVGVPSELQAAIFEPFRQGPTASPHSPGTGIGLSLVAMFAELHGGRAWVEDREGGGASFRVFLPGTPISAAASAPEPQRLDHVDAG
jgi:PAS domain S-box-containing protein